MSRSGTPAIPKETEKPEPVQSPPAETKHIKTTRDDLRPANTPRNSMAVPPKNIKNPGDKKQTMNFGQIDYGHGNMQSFMDPAYAHGKLDGAVTPPYQMAKKLQARLEHQEKVQSQSSPPQSPPHRQINNNNPGSNGSITKNEHMSSIAQLSPLREKPNYQDHVLEKPQYQEHIGAPTPRRVETVDSSTNTTSVRSSACTML